MQLTLQQGSPFPRFGDGNDGGKQVELVHGIGPPTHSAESASEKRSRTGKFRNSFSGGERTDGLPEKPEPNEVTGFSIGSHKNLDQRVRQLLNDGYDVELDDRER